MGIHLRARGFFSHRTNAESDLLFGRIHLDDLEFEFLSGIQLDRRTMPIHRFRVVAQALDSIRNLHECAEAGQAQHLAVNNIAHQMLILEQFDQLPVLLFSARYIEPGINVVSWKSLTQSLDKNSGKFIYDNGPENNNGAPQFFGFSVDSRAGTINMIGFTGTIQASPAAGPSWT